jgi:hypothetical protein
MHFLFIELKSIYLISASSLNHFFIILTESKKFSVNHTPPTRSIVLALLSKVGNSLSSEINARVIKMLINIKTTEMTIPRTLVFQINNVASITSKEIANGFQRLDVENQ